MQTLSRVAAISTLLATPIALASGQHRADLAQTLRTISASVTNGPSSELLRQLTDDIGARLVGSPGYERAAQWAVARFGDAGITNARFEQFTLPNAWQRGPAHARVVAPAARPLRIGSVGWGPSTPAGGVRGDVILISDLSPAGTSIAIDGTEE